MLCQHCNTNEAAVHFTVYNGYQRGEVHLCPQCAQQLERQYRQALDGLSGVGIWQLQEGLPWQGGAYEPNRADTERSIAEEVGFQHRRQLTELRYRLQQAVDDEDYEAAAKLRDEIKTVKKAGEQQAAKNQL